MAHVEYGWKRSKSADAGWFGNELEKIVERDGQVTPAAVVEIARPKKSPIHKEFEWDDQKAGSLYRHWQARSLTANLVVVQVGKDEITSPMRAFVSLHGQTTEGAEDGDEPSRAYHHIVTVLSDPEQRRQLLAQARGELNMWRKKYADLNEFACLIPAIDKVLEPAA